MANEVGGTGADASGAGAGAADAAAGSGGTQGGATGAQGGADASKSAEYWQGEAKGAFTKRDALAAELNATKAREAALAAKVAEFEKGKPAGQDAGQRVESIAGTPPVFDPKVVETTAATAGDKGAQARIEAWEATQKRAKMEDTVTGAFKQVGGQYEDLFAPMLGKAIADGKVAVDAAGRVQGAEVFIAGLRTTHPILFGTPPPGAIPGGAGAAVAQDLRKANPDGRRGSLARGPVYSEAQRTSADAALRKK